MKKLCLSAALLMALVLMGASNSRALNSHAPTAARAEDPTPQPTTPQDPDGGFDPDRRGPIDPFPPPTLWIISLQ